MTIKIILDQKTPGMPVGKVADAEVHFDDGILAGTKLVGFGIWERRGGGGFNVTSPSRTYNVGGERRSFALLRPIGSPDAVTALHFAITQEFLTVRDATEPKPGAATPRKARVQ